MVHCPRCGQPGVTDAAGKKPHPVRYCQPCDLVYDQMLNVDSRGISGGQVADPVAAYDGISQAREALQHPTKALQHPTKGATP